MQRHTRLTSDPLFGYRRFLDLGTARPIDCRLCNYVVAGEQRLEVAESFYYLGDTIWAGSSCEAIIITRMRAACGKFIELLSVL